MVTNSRHQKRANTVWRRRACTVCSQIFTTLEKPDLFASVMVQGRNLSLSGLERDKLFISIYEACKHRPKALTDASELTNTILGKVLLQVTDTGVIRSSVLAKTAHDVLGRFDKTAATVYQAYHPAN